MNNSKKLLLLLGLLGNITEDNYMNYQMPFDPGINYC